ncbi:hypothetical protein ACFUCT_25600 [Streptomyces parvus]
MTEDHELNELGFVTRMTAVDITLDSARTAAAVVDAKGQKP